MSEQRDTGGLEVYVRGNVSRNTKGWNSEHTVSVQGQMSISMKGGISFISRTEEGARIDIGEILDALHQEANAANQREIDRQRKQQLAAIQG